MTIIHLIKLSVLCVGLAAAGLMWLRRGHGSRTSGLNMLENLLRILVVGGILSVAIYTYARYVEPNWVMVSHLRITDDRLAKALGRTRIVQLTDLHIDHFGFRERTMIRHVNHQQPDWIVITGDLLNEHGGWPIALNVIGQLRARYGVWVIPGNTDNDVLSPQEFEEGLRSIGAHVLRNTRTPLGDTGAWLVGVDDPVEHRDRLMEALRGLTADALPPVILLAHSPDILTDAVAAHIPLVLVGHTHGGQLGIAWLRRFSDYANRGPYVSGGLYHQGETQLYVNRGLGSQMLPHRFLAPPEVAVIEFRPKTLGSRNVERVRRNVTSLNPITRYALHITQTNGVSTLWLSDFETTGEHAVRWKTRNAVITPATEHATHGHYAARVTFQESDESESAIMMEGFLAHDRARRNWSGYESLQFDLYNAQSTQERLILQLKDGHGHVYKEEIFIPAGTTQHVTVRVRDVAAYLDVTQITQLNLFRWRPGNAVTIYVDAIRLEPSSKQSALSDVSPAMAAAPPSSGSAGHSVVSRREMPLPSATPLHPAADWTVAWSSSLTKLFHDPAKFQGHASNPIQLSLARGEAESVQLVLVGGANRSHITLAAAPLTQTNGSAVIPPDAIEIRRVEYVTTAKPYYPVTSVGQWPDPLPLGHEVEVPARQVQPMWITITTPEDLPAGDYAGTITLTDANKRQEHMALQVHVWNFVLPRTPHLKTAFDFYETRLEQTYRTAVPGGEVWTGHMAELQDRYYTAMLKYHLSPVWSADPMLSQFAWDVKRYLDAGLTVFGIGHLGGNNDNNWPSDPVELEQAMVWYRQAALELKFYKLLDQAYVYAYDEPRPGEPHVAQVMTALHNADPGLKNLLVMNEAPDPVLHKEWLKDVDILCLRLSAFDPAQARAFTQLGKEVWMYVSSPAHPFPSLVIDYPAMAHRVLPWMAWKYGATGLLYWCVNFWDGNPWEHPASFQEDQNGNGFLFYPSVDGPVPSIRLEVLRDGIEDYEYLYRLRELIQAAKTRGRIDAATLAQAERLVNVDEGLVESLRNYSKDPEVLLAQRRAIAETIEKLQKGGS